MKKHIYLAMDFGSGSGRGLVGAFDGSLLRMDEISRFPNYFVNINGSLYWNTYYLYHEILKSARKVTSMYETEEIQSMGIDTWGTDFGLIDRNGRLLDGCRCIRNSDGTGMNAVNQIVSFSRLYRCAGIQCMRGNTLYQLYERKLFGDSALEQADTMLMVPDLLSYYLTGEKYAEYTIASTTMMLNPYTKKWNSELMSLLELSDQLLPPIIMPCEKAFPVRTGLVDDNSKWRLIPVASHDTASAVAAAPLKKGEIFCSSGTWSMIGIEREEPLISDSARKTNFSNEGTIDGKIRLLKNCMGMWAVQQCAARWCDRGTFVDWKGIVELAGGERPFISLVNLEEPEFYNAGDMVMKIQDYCRRTNQTIPESKGAIARCIYESMALRYRYIVEQLEKVTGKSFKAFRIVGGGIQNTLLNQFTANALDKLVITGPVEAACAGNILAQAVAAGDLGGFDDIRDVTERSFEICKYEPIQTREWDVAYGKYLRLINKRWIETWEQDTKII